MGFNVVEQNNVDENYWNKLLIKNHAATAYQISNWPKIYEATYGSKPFYISVETSNGNIVGQLASVLHNNLFWRDSNPFSSFLGTKFNLRSVLNWFYGPVIHDHENSDKIVSLILKKIDEIALREKITMVRGLSSPFNEHHYENQFTSFGYRIEPWSTYVTNLNQNIDELYNSLNKKTRYDIRKSENNDLEFVVAKNRDDYDDFSKIKIQSKQKTNQNVKSNPKFFDAHWELMNKPGYEELFLIKHNGDPISGLYGMIFNKKLIQHGVGNTNKTSLLGGTFLTWNAIKWSIDENLTYFDVGGANPNPELEKEKRIDFFKSKWGGKQYHYNIYTKIFNKTKTKIASFVKNPKNLRKKIISKIN